MKTPTAVLINEASGAEIGEPIPDIEAIEDKHVRSLVTKALKHASLVPVFKTDIRRTRWILKDELGNSIEVALDQGKIVADRKSLKISEVELELIEGDASLLFERALEWAAVMPLIPEPASKAARGYYLRLNEVLAPPVTAELPKLTAEMSPTQALAAIMKEALRHFHANARGVFLSDDMNHVHQARVALRRLRSAERAFSSLGSGPAWSDIRPELRWLAAELGKVRDLDVLLEKTFPPIESAMGSEVDFTPLREAATEWRTQHRAQVRVALQSPRYGMLILRLLQWIHSQDQASESAEGGLPQFAKRVLRKAERQLSRPLKKWDDLDSESRHDARKKVKRLRYLMEFFSTLYKKKEARRYLKALKKLQVLLGEINDAAATRMKMEELVARHPALAYGAGIVVGWAGRQAGERESDIRKAIEGLGSEKLPATG